MVKDLSNVKDPADSPKQDHTSDGHTRHRNGTQPSQGAFQADEARGID